MVYRDSTGKEYRLKHLVGRGGEAQVYQVAGHSGILAKIFLSPRAGYENKLQWMLEHPPEDPASVTGEIRHASIAWPLRLLYDQQGDFAGYLMPYIQEAVSILEVFNPRLRAQTLPSFDARYLYRTARNLATALQAIHGRSYVVGDLNESNVMVTPQALVTIIDTDSFQVRLPGWLGATVFPCPVGKLDYTPPELQTKAFQKTIRKVEHDRFALAVLIFQLLMDGNHPFRARWQGQGDPIPLEERMRRGWFPYGSKPSWPVAPPANAPDLERLHPSIAGLMRRCFLLGHKRPSRRPTPETWGRVIAAAERELIPCSRGHYYPNHAEDCPVCRSRQVSPVYPTRVVSGVTDGITRIQAGNRLRQKSQGWVRNTRRWFSRLSGLTLPRSQTRSLGPHKSPQKPGNPANLPWSVQYLRSLRNRLGDRVETLTGTVFFWAGIGVVLGALLGWWLGGELGGAAIGGIGGVFAGGKFGEVVDDQIGWIGIWMLLGTLAGGWVAWSQDSEIGYLVAGSGLGALGGGLLGVIGNQIGWELIWALTGAVVCFWGGREIGKLYPVAWITAGGAGLVVWGFTGLLYETIRRLNR